MASAIGLPRGEQRGVRGQRESAGVVRAHGAQRRSHGRLIAVAGRGGRRPPFPTKQTDVAGRAGVLLGGRARPARAIVTCKGETRSRGSIGAAKRR